jgi:hypothetical protein
VQYNTSACGESLARRHGLDHTVCGEVTLSLARRNL